MTDLTPLLLRARRVLAEPDRDSLRDAKRQRRAALPDYRQALDGMSARHLAAVLAHHAALSAEAAANRAEARETRELLAAVIRETGNDAQCMNGRYGDVHGALRRHFGSAVGRPCIVPGCRRLADGWGLVGEATNYGEKKDGTRVRWSTDLKDYAPLCFSHNAQLDRGGDLLMCPRGHVRITWGKDPHNSECIGCRRVRLREYKRRRRTDPAFRERENAEARARRARRRATDHRAQSAALPRGREQQETGQQAATKGTIPDEPR